MFSHQSKTSPNRSLISNTNISLSQEIPPIPPIAPLYIVISYNNELNGCNIILTCLIVSHFLVLALQIKLEINGVTLVQILYCATIKLYQAWRLIICLTMTSDWKNYDIQYEEKTTYWQLNNSNHFPNSANRLVVPNGPYHLPTLLYRPQ